MVQAFNIHSIKIKSSEAIKRDEQRNFAEALKQYAACFQALGQLLKEETLYEELKTNAQSYKQVVQAVKITKMCFERVTDIIEKEIPNSGNYHHDNSNVGGGSSSTTNGGSYPSSFTANTPSMMSSTSSFYVGTGIISSSGSSSTTTPPNSGNNSLRSSASFAYPLNQPSSVSNNTNTTLFNATPTSLSAASSNSFNNMSFQSSTAALSSSFMTQPSSPTLTPISNNSNNPLSKSMIVTSSTHSSFFSNRKSVELSSPTIEFQAPPGATFNTRVPSPLDNAYKPSLSEVTSFGLDPELSAKEKRKSLNLQASVDGDGADVTLDGDNAWSKSVRTKFIANYHKERTFKTRDELFDRELLAMESPADQWESVRTHMLSITDLISQHPINTMLIYFVQKFNEEFQVKEDTVWLSVHDANKQISDLANAIVVELTPLWASLQVAELRHYVTKALTEGIVKRVYRTLVEVYETQQQNKTTEEKLNAIGIVTLQDLGVEDMAIIEAADSFEPAIEILDNINVGKTPYSAIDSLVAMYAKIIELVNQVSNFDTLSDTTLYGLMLYIIQSSNTQNLPSTLNLIHDYVQDEELSQDEKDIISLVENVIDWANQFEV